LPHHRAEVFMLNSVYLGDRVWVYIRMVIYIYRSQNLVYISTI
jgi:hypothetical protein